MISVFHEKMIYHEYEKLISNLKTKTNNYFESFKVREVTFDKTDYMGNAKYEVYNNDTTFYFSDNIRNCDVFISCEVDCDYYETIHYTKSKKEECYDQIKIYCDAIYKKANFDSIVITKDEFTDLFIKYLSSSCFVLKGTRLF